MAPTDPLQRYLRRPTRRRLAKVVRAHYDFVWRAAYRVSRNEDDAAEICQDVFLRLLLEPPAAGTVASPRGFLSWRVLSRAGTLKREHARRREREREHARRLGGHGVDAADLDVLKDAIDRLPEVLAVPLRLRYLAGLPVGAIAETLGVSTRTLRRRLDEARGRLRKLVAPHLALLLALPATGSGAVSLPAPPPPAGLLPDLMKTVDLGSAIAPPAGGAGGALADRLARIDPAAGAGSGSLLSAGVGGMVMSTQKIAVTAGIGVLLVVGGIYLATRTTVDDSRITGEQTPASARVERGTATAEHAAGSSAETTGAGSPEVAPAPAPVRPALRGRVISESAEGVAGARVWALELPGWNSEAVREVPDRGDTSRLDVDSLHTARAAYERCIERLPVAETGGGGWFEFTPADLKPAEFKIVVVHPDFLPSHSSTIAVTAGQTAEVEIALSSARLIAGRVVDGRGAPIPGAEVVAESSDLTSLLAAERVDRLLRRWGEGRFLFDPAKARTDERGRFRLGSLEPVLYDLAVRKRGHGRARLWEVAAGSDDVVITLTRGSELRGRVVAPDGVPVPGAAVRLASSAISEVHRVYDRRLVDLDPFGEAWREQRTDSAGKFVFVGLEPGKFDLAVEPDRFAFHLIDVEIVAGVNELGDIELGASRRLAGTVENSAGEPVASARVWVAAPLRHVEAGNSLRRPEPKALVEATSGDRGGFVLEGLPAGEHTVYADAEGFVRGTVEASSPSDDVAVILDEGYSLLGRVTVAGSGEPLAGVAVSTGFGQGPSTMTDDEGLFELSGIGPGDLLNGRATLEVEHPDFVTARRTVAVAAWSRSERLEIRLGTAQKIRGTVEDVTGRPVPDASVRLVSHNLPAAAAGWDPTERVRSRSDANGDFELDSPEELRGRIGDVGIYIVAVHPLLAPSRVGPLSFPGLGESWPEVVVEMAPGVVLHGRVVDPKGRPVRGARIVVEPWGGNGQAGAPSKPRDETRSGTTDAEGRYRIAGVAGGQATLRATALGFAPTLDELELDAGENLRDITLSPGATIGGRVVDSHGTPLHGVDVQAFPSGLVPSADPERASEFVGRMMLRIASGSGRAHTGRDGQFTLRDLPSGEEYSLVARAKGFEATITAEVAAGADSLEIVLERFSVIEGIVVGDDGAPITVFEVDLVNVEKNRAARKKRGGYHDYRVGSEGRLRYRDPQGRFAYDGLRPGAYRIYITAENRIPHQGEIEVGVDDIALQRFTLARGAEVAGAVVDAETGAPIAEAAVMVTRTSRSPGRSVPRMLSRTRVTTGVDGRFRLAGLEEGSYQLMVTHPLYLVDYANAPKFDVSGNTSAGPFGPFELRLESAGRIEGRLTGVRRKSDKGHRVRYSLKLDRVKEKEEKKDRGQYEPGLYVDPRGYFHQDSLQVGMYRLKLTVQEFEYGESVHLGPMGGFVSNKDVGKPQVHDLGTIEIPPGRTTVIERPVPRAVDEP